MNKDSCSFMNVSQCNALVYDCLCFYFLLWRRYISYRLLYLLSFFIFEPEAIPFWYWLLESMTKRIGYQVLIKCQYNIPSNMLIAINRLHQNSSNQRLNNRLIQSKHLIKCNKTSFKKSINSDPHLAFHLEIIRRPKPIFRTNAYFPLFQRPTRSHDY